MNNFQAQERSERLKERTYMATRQSTLTSFSRLILAGSLLLALPLMSACNNKPDSSEALSHVTRAETYADQGQFRSALLEAKNAIQKEPDNVEHIVLLANLYLDVGAPQEASELLAPWVEEAPQAVALPLARAYVEQGKHLSASETLALQTPDSRQDQLEASLIRAEALRKSGELAEALALYNNLTSSNSSNADAMAGLLKTQINMGRDAQAVETADEWLGKNESAPDVLYWKGVAQYRINELEQASETLTDAVAVLPTSDFFLPIRRSVLTTLSRVLTEQGKITEAQIYNQILAENLDTGAQEQGKAAIAAIKEKNFEEAKSILRDTLKLNPDNERMALLLGALSAGTGELEEGTQLLTENLDPETSPTQFIKAATMARIDTGEREAALKTLDRAIEARPNDNELLAMHGILALSLPDHESRGVASLSKAISNEPDRVRFRLALARHYLQKGKTEQALGELRMAFTSNPAEWTTTSTYLNVLIQQGEEQEAFEIRDSLINGYGNEPRAILLASLVDAKLGNPEQATARLEKLIEENPDLQAPKVALASLYTQSGKRESAVNLLIDAAEQTPEVIRPLQQAGQVYAMDHTAAETKTWLGKTAETHPRLQQNANILIALINMNQGELAEARALLSPLKDSESTTADRAYTQLLLTEAQVAANNKEWETARTKAAEAITREPENLRLSLLPVNIAQMEGDIESAYTALDAVEQTHGRVTTTVITRAKLLQQEQGPKAAYEYLLDQWETTNNAQLMTPLVGLAKQEAPGTIGSLTEDWLNAAPQNLAAHLARAQWLMSNNQETEAANHYEQILAKQPNNVPTLNNLAWTLRDKNPERALRLARKASELAPNNPAILDTYGWILHLRGEHHRAVEVIEQALALAPDNREIAEHLKQAKQQL